MYQLLRGMVSASCSSPYQTLEYLVAGVSFATGIICGGAGASGGGMLL
jgi:hypothetical protein